MRALKQTLNNGLVLKKVHRVIQFNQKACLKPYIDKNYGKCKKTQRYEAFNNIQGKKCKIQKYQILIIT